MAEKRNGQQLYAVALRQGGRIRWGDGVEVGLWTLQREAYPQQQFGMKGLLYFQLVLL